jgi:hypothetical protein
VSLISSAPTTKRQAVYTSSDSEAEHMTSDRRMKLHNEELHNLYSSPDIIRQIKSRRIRWAEHVACMGEERKLYKVLVGKPEGKRPLGRPRQGWEDGIKMDLRFLGSQQILTHCILFLVI